MTREKAEASAKPAVASKSTAATDHEYAMETSTLSAKRKTSLTPTKALTPPSKGTVSQSVETNNSIIEVINKLTNKIDDFGVQLSNNMIMVANIAKLAEMNAADIKDCKAKLSGLEKDMPALNKENVELKERMLELERYMSRWNLKIQGWTEKSDEDTRKEVIDILAKITPHWASSLGNAVDTVHCLGKKEVGRPRQIIVQFTMRHYQSAFWKLTKDSRVCKELGIYFKQDFCKLDREARAAVWPKMEQARAEGKNVYYRGHAGYINGVRVFPG
ncbi:RING finger protein [Sarotherodon galilaeus]